MAKARGTCPRTAKYKRTGGKKGPRCLRTRKSATRAKKAHGGSLRKLPTRGKGSFWNKSKRRWQRR